MSTSTNSSPEKYPWQELAGYETAMDVAWNFSYEINSEKLRNLYSKAKQNQWDAETQLDWSIEIDPSKPIVGEDRFPFLKLPFFQKLSKTTARDVRRACDLSAAVAVFAWRARRPDDRRRRDPRRARL